MSDDDLRLGGAPPLVPGPSLEAEERAMRGGRGPLFAAVAALGLLLVGGIAFFILGSDDLEPYRTLGRNVNGIESEYFDSFWGCVFQAEERIGSNEDLQREIHERATNGGSRFAAHVRQRCMSRLDQMEPRLRALIPPLDLAPKVDAMVEATASLRSAWSDYVGYLETAEVYDEEDAQPRVSRIARGGFEFERAQNEIDAAVRERLTP
jgi:hypothetical protein